MKLKAKLIKDSVIELPIIIASEPETPSELENSSLETNELKENLKENLENVDSQSKGTLFYLIGRPTPRLQEPFTPKGEAHICFTAEPSLDGHPEHLVPGVRRDTAVYYMAGSPVKYKGRISLV